VFPAGRGHRRNSIHRLDSVTDARPERKYFGFKRDITWLNMTRMIKRYRSNVVSGTDQTACNAWATPSGESTYLCWMHLFDVVYVKM
jgi:hypothetical protein